MPLSNTPRPVCPDESGDPFRIDLNAAFAQVREGDVYAMEALTAEVRPVFRPLIEKTAALNE